MSSFTVLIMPSTVFIEIQNKEVQLLTQELYCDGEKCQQFKRVKSPGNSVSPNSRLSPHSPCPSPACFHHTPGHSYAFEMNFLSIKYLVELNPWFMELLKAILTLYSSHFCQISHNNNSALKVTFPGPWR